MITVPQNVTEWVSRGAASAGAPELVPILIALAYAESRFDPEAVGDAGCSKGLLQFNQCGGLGQGHPDAELFDPVASAALAARSIRGRLAANGGDLYDALAPWSTRNEALALLPQLEGAGAPVGNGGAGSAPAAPGGAAVVGLVLLGLALWLAVR